MEEYFFSEKNISDLTKKLILNLELSKEQLNKDVVMKCKKIIINHMKDTYSKYGDNKPPSISSKDYVIKMNNKSLKDCIKIFDNKKKNDSYSLPEKQNKPNKINNQYGIGSMDNQFLRPDEIMGKMKNPSHPQQQSNPSKELQSFSDAGGYASFSSLDSASGPFITATGEYGMPLEMENTRYPGMNEGKKNYADELEQKLSSMNGLYGGGPGMGMGMNGMQMGQQMPGPAIRGPSSGGLVLRL